MNAQKYKQILIHQAKPNIEKLFTSQSNWKFQHNNDPKHIAKIVTNYFENNNLSIIDWPAQSHDLNTIENLWKEIKKRTIGKKHQSEDEIFQILKDIWINIDKNILKTLVESMTRRCQAVIKAKRWPTKY